MSSDVPSRASTSEAPRTEAGAPRWRRLATQFVFNLVGFGLITELLSSWWEPGHDFTLWAIPIRGVFFAVFMLCYTLWTDRTERRERHSTESHASHSVQLRKDSQG